MCPWASYLTSLCPFPHLQASDSTFSWGYGWAVSVTGKKWRPGAQDPKARGGWVLVPGLGMGGASVFLSVQWGAWTPCPHLLPGACLGPSTAHRFMTLLIIKGTVGVSGCLDMLGAVGSLLPRQPHPGEL